LRLPNGAVAEVDFRELSALGWLNTMLGDDYQERPMIAAICRHLHAGSVFWDIGSNAGIVSYEISHLAKYREHHYFEPNPKIYPWVEAALSHLDHATGHKVALSGENGSATFYVPRKGSAFGSLEGGGDADREEIQVSKRTCDSLVFEDGLLPPSVIKIDTEGHEIQVLAGMKRIIELHRPVIFFEHIEISDEEIRSLVPAGYSLKTVSNSKGGLTDSFEREAGHNSVLLPDPA
jgi:FkbM family methyltransferase